MFRVSSYSFRIEDIPGVNLKLLESFWFLVSGFMLSENNLRKLETRNLKLETPLSDERRFTEWETNAHRDYRWRTGRAHGRRGGLCRRRSGRSL